MAAYTIHIGHVLIQIATIQHILEARIFIDGLVTYVSLLQRNQKRFRKEQLFTLYQSVGWSAYTNNMDQLTNAIKGSSYVCAVWDKDTLVALVRCISDDASIMYLQDVLVQPPISMRRGIGRVLVQNENLDRYSHVRQKL